MLCNFGSFELLMCSKKASILLATHEEELGVI
jgi:hypothetical protein